MKVFYSQHGPPLEVLKVEDDAPGRPGPGEALVSGILAPINPADLNAIEGSYPVSGSLPRVPGVEGVGIVEAVGPGAEPLTPGTRVLFPHGYGTWREAGVLPAKDLTVVPPEVPFREAAMLKINPATAWRMLHDFVEPEPGAWVLQNAANSAVGRHVIAMARELGLKTVNLVRRPDLVEELSRAGGDVVLVDGEDAIAQVRERTGGAPIRLALNAVGGESGTRLARLTAPGGAHVTYGAMSRQAFRLPAGVLIFKQVEFRGFWISRWYEKADPADRQAMMRQLFDMAARGVIRTPVERVYPVAQVRDAVARAQEGGRSGKILLGRE